MLIQWRVKFEDRNIVLVEKRVGISSTKLLAEVELAELSQKEALSSGTQNVEHLQTYSLARDWERREIHPSI